MGTLLAYSGLATKIKAMSSHLITDREFREIASLSTVQEVAQYLKKHPAYQNDFAGFDDTSLHRGDIERVLHYSVYNDFSKLYRFADKEQRSYLKMYFSRYEVQILKSCLRKIFDSRSTTLELGRFYPFFEKHSAISFSKAAASSSVEELTDSLKGSIYYDAFCKVSSSSELTLFDYEIALDLLYFISTWKQISRMSDATGRKILTETIGSQIDLLNIQWIYRSKRYYRMSSADIYALIIPVHYKLKKDTMSAMVEAASLEEVAEILQTTYYAKHFEEATITALEQMYRSILKKLYEASARKYPYSIACISTYLYHKEHEATRLISVLEGIRYGLPSDEILKIVM